MTTPADLRHVPDLTRHFARNPRYLLALRNLLVGGVPFASRSLRPVDICTGPGGLDTMDVDMLQNYGLLTPYRSLSSTHPMSAAPCDALCLTPFAVSWLTATDEVLRGVGKPFLVQGEVETFTINPTTRERKPVKVWRWKPFRTIHVSRNIHEIARKVALMATERSAPTP